MSKQQKFNQVLVKGLLICVVAVEVGDLSKFINILIIHSPFLVKLLERENILTHIKRNYAIFAHLRQLRLNRQVVTANGAIK